jgi:hypothetical protein
MSLLLKHIAFRIWSAVLLAGLVSLWVLPTFQSRIGLDWNLPMVGAILISVFFGVGWALNRWGLSRADRLINEAAAFERDGMDREAENAFRQAVAVFDSFLVSPAVKRKKSNDLSARMARFYLGRAHRDHASEAFLISYLQSNPQDEEVAENWLRQVESRSGFKEGYQELVSRIGSAHPKNHNIQRILAQFYLLMERTDFVALQTYRWVYEGNAPVAHGFVDELARLFLREKRADEWALDVYLQASMRNSDQTKYYGALAACVRWTPRTERNKQSLQAAYQHLEGIDVNEIKKMSAGFKPPIPPPPQPKARPGFDLGNIAANGIKALLRLPSSFLRWVTGRARYFIELIRHSTKARRVLTGTSLALLVLGTGGLVINTVGYLSVSEKPPSKKAEPAPAVITDSFTLQVAAYLQPEYAKKFVEQLKMLGEDAYWTEAVRGEKRWYQVRISHFPDKNSARNYGDVLKSKGIIEDYYVANYRRQ